MGYFPYTGITRRKRRSKNKTKKTSPVKDWTLSERCKSCSAVCFKGGHDLCLGCYWNNRINKTNHLTLKLIQDLDVVQCQLWPSCSFSQLSRRGECCLVKHHGVSAASTENIKRLIRNREKGGKGRLYTFCYTVTTARTMMTQSCTKTDSGERWRPASDFHVSHSFMTWLWGTKSQVLSTNHNLFFLLKH